MKITKDNIDNYYQIVNDKIDQHFGKYINPSNLKRYLSPDSKGMKKFIESEDLKEVERIEKIVSDCVNDRVAVSERDILTFESFTYNENEDLSVIYNLRDQTPMDDKEIREILRDLSDIYETSVSKMKFLGDVDFYSDDNQKTNRILMEDIEGEKEVIFFNNFFVYKYLEVISGYIYEELTDDNYKMPFLDIEIDLKKVIDKEEFINNTKYFILNNKIEILKHMIEVQLGGEYEFFSQVKGLLIFEKK
jgi:hypothetical protein